MKTCIILFIAMFVTVAASAQTVTGIFLPQYIQGAGTFDPADDRKVPFVARLKFSGLQPATTYRYFNRFVSDTASTSNGEGPYIIVKDTGDFIRVTSASLSVSGRYGEFTTDSTGSYTGWFANEPGTSGTFLAGATVYLRIMLNNGAGGGGVATRLTLIDPISVINFGSTSADGTALRSTPLRKGAAKQFVLLYDNIWGIYGNRRPLTGTFIESDGTDNSIANGYAPFYADSVNGINKAWGVILPNNSSSGVRHIAQLSLAGAKLANLYLSFDGKWPSVNNTNINTRNASGGLNNVLVIDGIRLCIVNLFLDGESTDDDIVSLKWYTPEEPNAQEYVVERSTDGGRTFNVINTTRAGGNKELYELKDDRNDNATFYRVAMRGKDGSVTHSDVLKVPGAIRISTYPNPVRDQLIVKHPAAEAGATVQVIGTDGQKYLSRFVQQGATQTTVNVSRLLPGNYRLVFQVSGQTRSRNFIKY